jgi:hypothetical protein
MGDDCLPLLKQDIAYIKELYGMAPAQAETPSTEWLKGTGTK